MATAVQVNVTKDRALRNRLLAGLYAVATVVSISIWFIALRAPMRLDETGSFWMISSGITGIWPRHFIALLFPAYSYILWLSTQLIGTSEVALRIPSILAMLGAAYLFYLAARELFSRDIATISVVVFCLNPTVIFEAIDVRPYAFATLATNAAIIFLLRLKRNDSIWLAGVAGLLFALPMYFHTFFGVILPASCICLLVLKYRKARIMRRQMLAFMAAFMLGNLPLLASLLGLVSTAGSHVYEQPPSLSSLYLMLAPGWVLPVFAMTALAALLFRILRPAAPTGPTFYRLDEAVICFVLGFVPLLILFGVSRWTPLHLFAGRHCLAAIPGISLSWGFAVSRFRLKTSKALFCVLLVGVSAFSYYTMPTARQHETPWKYALDFVQKQASIDNAPVLMCSGYIESNYLPMPTQSLGSSQLFSPLAYYHLSVPVVAMPEGLNEEAIRIGTAFEIGQKKKRARFLAMGNEGSYKTLDWLVTTSRSDFSARTLRVIDGFKIVEFAPVE